MAGEVVAGRGFQATLSPPCDLMTHSLKVQLAAVHWLDSEQLHTALPSGGGIAETPLVFSSLSTSRLRSFFLLRFGGIGIR